MQTTRMPTVSMDDIPAIRKLYDECEGEIFMFKGVEIYKPYAKYLLEYLEGERKRRGL